MQLIDVLDERIIDLNAEAANKEEVQAISQMWRPSRRISICARVKEQQESAIISLFRTEKVIL